MNDLTQTRRNWPIVTAAALAWAVLAWVILCCVPAAAMGDEPPELRAVRLVPNQTALWGTGSKQRFVALAKCSDGRERDVSHLGRFSVVDTTRARVDSTGQVTSVGTGRTILRVELGDHSAEAAIQIQPSTEERPFSFARDIEGILTRRGCNVSECHGGVKGRGGFKLSLNGLHPREDYNWIVAGGVFQVLTDKVGEPQEPRVDPRQPRQSLLLLKPTMTVSHDGGERFEVDSDDYKTLERWIRGGAPYGEAADIARPARIEVQPLEDVLDQGGRRQLLVTAEFSTGSTEDLTEQVQYVSSNPEVVRVSEQGIVNGIAPGEAFVTVRSPGHKVSVRFGITAGPVSAYPEVPRHNFIDEHVFSKLEKLAIVPSELSSDAEFLRRICLGLTGTLPPPGRVRDFLNDTDPDKRERLIDTLLQTPEYVDYWTFRLAQLFRVRGSSHPEHGYAYWHWLRDGVVNNRSYDQLARERIAGQGYQGPSRHYPLDDFHPAELMGEQVRVFWGRRLQCAQCHNHPFEDWTQNQFWGLAAFFGKMSRTDWSGFAAHVIFDDPAGPDPDYGSPEETVQVKNPRTGVEVPPTFLDGQLLPADKQPDLRMHLAEWMTDHPYFAEAAVNRVWSHLFRTGLVDPVDDFRSDNPPTHPALLQALAADFRAHGHDLKHLVRRIVLSRTYQLSSIPNESNRADPLNYSHYASQPLDAELLLDAISQVTGLPQVFDNSQNGRAPAGTRAIQLVVPDIYPSRFLDVYGRRSRDRLPAGMADSNLNQALHMLVGTTYTAGLSQPGGRVDRGLKKGATDAEIMEELYLASFCRFPTTDERHAVQALIAGYDSREIAFEDLIWALVSAREFASNH